MNKSIVELQDCNKDVLLGKKNVNCLSCNKGTFQAETVQHVKGKDGHFYVGSDLGKGASDFSANIEESNKVNLDQGTLVFDQNTVRSPRINNRGAVGQRAAGYAFKSVSMSHQNMVTRESARESTMEHNL